MTENKRHYWGIVDNGETVYKGTFKQCWDEFVSLYGDNTMQDLTERGCKISRVA